ncbi:hypothetical protein AFLA_010220 [Aspergillus flavus NRRL3357]|nr:hypothetical protein AFLA_010220 [Aspergillus flavus NRRL3357]
MHGAKIGCRYATEAEEDHGFMADAPDPSQVTMPMILVLGWLVGILDLLV